jgi:tRNA threonylcarbamoyladenosine biosynthesis protein TsaE
MRPLPFHISGEGAAVVSEVAASILEFLPQFRIIAFSGTLGAGKTTLIQELCRKLGVQHAVNSPTFSLVNEYRAGETTIYHFDWYRIDDPQELLDIGIFEYLDSTHLCFIEWPSRAEVLLEGMPVLKVNISHAGQGRSYELSA